MEPAANNACTELDCGIAMRRIAGWLKDELCLSSAESGRYLFTNNNATCSVHIAPLENRSFGTLELERTHMRIEGDLLAVEAFMRLFTLRFISAGG